MTSLIFLWQLTRQWKCCLAAPCYHQKVFPDLDEGLCFELQQHWHLSREAKNQTQCHICSITSMRKEDEVFVKLPKHTRVHQGGFANLWSLGMRVQFLCFFFKYSTWLECITSPPARSVTHSHNESPLLLPRKFKEFLEIGRIAQSALLMWEAKQKRKESEKDQNKMQLNSK